jgi:hypothetical protein
MNMLCGFSHSYDIPSCVSFVFFFPWFLLSSGVADMNFVSIFMPTV